MLFASLVRGTRSAIKFTAAAAGGAAGLLASQAVYVKVNFTLPPEAVGPTAGLCGHGVAAKRKNIVFMGDSIVTGVGCRQEAGEGPVLPRRVAEVVAERLDAEVAWTALGETGADVPTLRKDFIPSLRREAEHCAENGGRVDAVVVLCGLNDIKECFLHLNPRRHPGSFRHSLHELVDAIREVAGHECAVLLPAMPIDASPRFNSVWPLSVLVHQTSYAWERQKQLLAETRRAEPEPQSVSFLQQPAHTPLEYFSEDGMHPNDVGYTAWAEYIAQHLLVHANAFPAEAKRGGE